MTQSSASRSWAFRTLVLVYGSLSYAAFLGAFVYAAGFLSNAVVPRGIDSGATAPLAEALAVNAGLLGLFAVQHSGMARRAFKRGLTRILPQQMERSTYVLATSLVLFLLFWQWRPIAGDVWNLAGTSAGFALDAISLAGWGIVFLATCMIHHFDLFGMRQTWLAWRGKRYRQLGFRTPGFYRFIRHPIQVGFLVAFWATAHMTHGHLLFAAGTTGYILLALRWEERDLIREFGETYRRYKSQVAMFLPIRKYSPERK